MVDGSVLTPAQTLTGLRCKGTLFCRHEQKLAVFSVRGKVPTVQKSLREAGKLAYRYKVNANTCNENGFKQMQDVFKGDMKGTYLWL